MLFLSFHMFVFFDFILCFAFLPSTLLAFFPLSFSLFFFFVLFARALSRVHVISNIETQFLRISTEIALSWSSNKIQNKLFLLLFNLEHRTRMRLCPIEVKWKWLGCRLRAYDLSAQTKILTTIFQDLLCCDVDCLRLYTRVFLFLFLEGKRFRLKHFTFSINILFRIFQYLLSHLFSSLSLWLQSSESIY